MKKIILLPIAALFIIAAHAQIEPGVYATGAVGVNASGHSIVSAGLHANLDRFYTGVNASPAIDGTVIYEARAGVIMGQSISAVPYVGYGVRVYPKQFDEDGNKFAGAAPSKGLTYGMLLTAPTAWDKTRLLLSFQFFDGKPAVAAGFKVQLTNTAPCNR